MFGYTILPCQKTVKHKLIFSALISYVHVEDNLLSINVQ